MIQIPVSLKYPLRVTVRLLRLCSVDATVTSSPRAQQFQVHCREVNVNYHELLCGLHHCRSGGVTGCAMPR